MPVISLIFFTCVITNPVHHNYYTTFEYRNVVCGRLYYLSQIVYYLLIFAGICLMFIKHSQSNRRMTSQSVLIAIAIAVPLCINTLSVVKIIDTEIELTPLFFAFSVVMILIAISRFGLLNVNRIAINDTIDSIDSAVIVFDADDIMTYKNKYAETLISLETGATLDELIAALGDPYTYYMDASEYAAFTQGVESETTIVGIGAGIRYTERGIELVSVYAGSGAEDAGLRAGDVILAIDGVSCVPGSEQHRDRILGAEGSTVMLDERKSTEWASYRVIKYRFSGKGFEPAPRARRRRPRRRR
jgi:hypothetical protein